MINDAQPTYFDMPGRIIVIGDVHGDIKRFMGCLYDARVFSKDLQWIAQPADTVVIQLGDQIDSMTRGPMLKEWEDLPDVEMLQLTNTLDSIARINGGRVLSIIGNHEIMNVMSDFTYVSQRSRELYDINLRKANFRVKDGMFAKILAKRNLVLKVGPYLFCHGGLLPSHLDSAGNNLYAINDALRKFLLGKPTTQDDDRIIAACLFENGIIWTRFYTTVDKDVAEQVLNKVLQRTVSSAMFVGHSTVPSTTVISNKLVLADAALSRSFGTNAYQYLSISGSGDTVTVHNVTT